MSGKDSKLEVCTICREQPCEKQQFEDKIQEHTKTLYTTVDNGNKIVSGGGKLGNVSICK